MEIKSLVLAQKQKDNLLEMCRGLFPKYKWEFASDYGTINDETQVDALIQWKITGKYSQIFISTNHWFEFCVKHLIPKVANIIQSTIDMRILFCESSNPIEYLYQQFKKLKK